MAAALVLSLVALWQTWRMDRLTPPGDPVMATVLSRELRRPYPQAALAESVVVLSLTDPQGRPFEAVTPHPPATLTELWPGARVRVTLSGDPPRIAYWPQRPARDRRATLIALAIALGLAAVSGLLSRVVPR